VLQYNSSNLIGNLHRHAESHVLQNSTQMSSSLTEQSDTVLTIIEIST
jgi:hypothetical protein